MNPDIGLTAVLTRFIWALAIGGIGLAGYILLSRWMVFRANKNRASQVLPPGIRPGLPAVLYFTLPDCAPCKTIQQPALHQLKTRLGDQVQVIEINLQDHPDLASRWGILSVPTTYILDSQGNVCHVNHGATRADKLLDQIIGRT